jgi:hypothetical protein
MASRNSLLLEQFLAGFSIVACPQSEKGCCFAVLLNFLPKSLAVPAIILNFGAKAKTSSRRRL